MRLQHFSLGNACFDTWVSFIVREGWSSRPLPHLQGGVKSRVQRFQEEYFTDDS